MIVFWVGREKIVEKLIEKLNNSCRLLLILGITGVGKTALAEKTILEFKNNFITDNSSFQRITFDAGTSLKDFTTLATQWLDNWGINLPPQGRNPEQLLHYLTQYLCKNTCLLLIDSMENILTGNEEEGWGNFVDIWWERFFLSILSADFCQSKNNYNFSRFTFTISATTLSKILASSYINWFR